MVIFFFNLNLKTDSAASSGDQREAKFPWPPLEAALLTCLKRRTRKAELHWPPLEAALST